MGKGGNFNNCWDGQDLLGFGGVKINTAPFRVGKNTGVFASQVRNAGER